jgi:hypothetical protein
MIPIIVNVRTNIVWYTLADIAEWVDNNLDIVSVCPNDGSLPVTSIFNGLLFADEQDAVYFKLKFGL